MYNNIQKDIKNLATTHLIIKTIGIIDYYKKYKKYSKEEIEKAINARGGDVSIGSTYVIDLQNNISYRFRDHKRYMSRADFRGFIIHNQSQKLSESANLEDLNKNKEILIIRESIKGEVHDSTPIEKINIIPVNVLNKALRDKNIEPAINLWNALFK